jgi:hypothetical protein
VIIKWRKNRGGIPHNQMVLIVKTIIIEGGYTSTTYFSTPFVNQADIYGETLINKGTDAGGAVEVYTTVEDANKRDSYLAFFDGSGMFASGLHVVFGTMVIRTSDELTATQQKELTEQIKTILIELR